MEQRKETYAYKNKKVSDEGSIKSLLIRHTFVHAEWLSRVRLSATPWTVAQQAPLSVGFSRQGYWSELPCPPPGDLPNPGFEPTSPTLAGGFFTASATWEALAILEGSV